MDQDYYSSGYRDGYAQAIKDVQAEQLKLWHAVQRAVGASHALDSFITDRRHTHPTVDEVDIAEAQGVEPY